MTRLRIKWVTRFLIDIRLSPDIDALLIPKELMK